MESEGTESPQQQGGDGFGGVPPAPLAPGQCVPQLGRPIHGVQVEQRDHSDELVRDRSSGDESEAGPRPQIAMRERDVLLPRLDPSCGRKVSVHPGVVEQAFEVPSIRPPNEP